MKLRIDDVFRIQGRPAVQGRLPESLPEGFAIEPGHMLRTPDGRVVCITGVESDLTSNPFAPGKPFVFGLDALRGLRAGDDVELCTWADICERR